MRASLLVLALFACTSTTTPDTDGVDTTTGDPTPTPTDTVDDTPEPSDPCLIEPTVLRVGIGETEFTAVESGADVFMVHGPQGEPTWHVDVAVEVENSTETVVVEQAIYRDSDNMLLAEPLQRATVLVPEDGPGGLWTCDGSLVNLRSILDPAQFGLDETRVAPWDELCGVDVRIEVSISAVGDGLGDLTELASTSQVVRLQPDPCDCAACGTDTPVCEKIGTEDCTDTLFVKWCERPPDYCPLPPPSDE